MKTTPQPKQRIKLLIFDDSADIRDGFTSLLKFYEDIQVLSAHPDANNALEIVKKEPPDVILMDIDMPGLNGIEASAMIKHLYPKIEIIILSQFHDNTHVFEAIKSGASGYLVKGSDTDQVVASIRVVAAGGSPMNDFVARKTLEEFRKMLGPKMVNPGLNALSDRELDVLNCMAEGSTYKEIAADLAIAVDTVRSHIRSIYEKLQVNSKTEAVLVAIEKKIIQLKRN